MSTYNVLFLCTVNSARSIMAFNAYSAGSSPKGEVPPMPFVFT